MTAAAENRCRCGGRLDPSGDERVVVEVVTEYLLRYRASTAAAYRSDLRDAEAWAGGQGLTLLGLCRRDVQAYGAHLRDERGLSPATCARRLSSLCGLLRYAHSEGLLARDPTAGVLRPRVQGSARHLTLWPDDIVPLLEAANQHSKRAAALVSVLLLTGLRAQELLAADVTDLVWRGGRWQLQVLRKGGRPDVVPLADHSATSLLTYVSSRDSGPLILSRTGQRLERRSAVRVLRQVAALCLPPDRAKRLTLHATRHCYASACADAGVSTLDLRRALGHQTDRHVQVYVQMAKAYRKAHPTDQLATTLQIAASVQVGPQLPSDSYGGLLPSRS